MALNDLTLSAQLRLIRRGECSVFEILEACLARIRAREPSVQAWQHVADSEQLLQDLRSREASVRRLPLCGLPLAVKDTIDVVGFPAERGSSIYAGRRPDADASCVAILRASGATVLGKTVTTEFAYFSPGKTRNPHHIDHTPGGSSSGSAAAVADHMVPMALGTQTAGSVIRPAAFCGSPAFVASRGVHSLRGVMPLSHTFDSLGFFARSVEDLQILHSSLIGAAIDGAVPTAVKELRRVLVLSGTQFGPVSDAMAAATERVVATLVKSSVTVERLDALPALQWAVEDHEGIMAYEASRTLAYEFAVWRERLSAPLIDLIEKGLALPFNEYQERCLRLNRAALALREVLAKVDAVAAPAAPGEAPGRASTGNPCMSRPWHALGLPQLSIPVRNDAGRLPLGVQLVSARRSDATLLAMGRTVESLGL